MVSTQRALVKSISFSTFPKIFRKNGRVREIQMYTPLLVKIHFIKS